MSWNWNKNPLAKRLIHEERKNVFHSSAYAKAQSGEVIGAASIESFDERQKIEQNRKIIRGYNDSRVATQRYAGAPRAKQYTQTETATAGTGAQVEVRAQSGQTASSGTGAEAKAQGGQPAQGVARAEVRAQMTARTTPPSTRTQMMRATPPPARRVSTIQRKPPTR